MPAPTRAVYVLILAGMSALIVCGAVYQNGPGQVAASLVPFWGKFVWTDITATFLLFATLIFAYERSLVAGLAMFILMNLFGAAAIAAWLLWRGPDLYRRIDAPRS
jgi:hypothetical protein